MSRLNLNPIGSIGDGQFFQVTLPPQPINQDWSFQIPSHFGFELVSVAGVFVTDANVGARILQPFSSYNNTDLVRLNVNLPLNPSINYAVQLAPGFDLQYNNSNILACGLPRMFAPAGGFIGCAVINKQAGDQWTALSISGFAHPLK